MFFDDNPDWFSDMIFGAGGAALSNASTSMAQSISDGLLAMEEPANELQEKLNEAGIGWNSFWSQAAGTFGAENAVAFIGGGVTQFNVKSWIDGSVFNAIEEAFNSFSEFWDTTWEAIFKAIPDSFENWRDPIMGIWDMITQAFPVLDAYDWGVELVESFFDGIMATISSFGVASSIGRGISDKVQAGTPDRGRYSESGGSSGPSQHSDSHRSTSPDSSGYSGGSTRIESYSASRFSTPEATMSAQRSSFSADAVSIGRMVELLEDIADKDTKISLEGDAAGVFRMVERENKRRTRATRYNSLSMVRS